MDGSSVRFENNKGNGVLSDIFGEEFNLLKLSHLLSDFRLHQSLGGGAGGTWEGSTAKKQKRRSVLWSWWHRTALLTSPN